MNWDELRAYSLNQKHLSSPERTDASNAQYATYKAWCESRGMTNADYVLKYAQWSARGIAFEPCLAPYHLENHVQHWILWHHPSSGTPGDAVLDPVAELNTV